MRIAGKDAVKAKPAVTNDPDPAPSDRGWRSYARNFGFTTCITHQIHLEPRHL
jgi:hypothetical protein